MRLLTDLFAYLGVPLAPDKVCGPARILTFLGIEIDSIQRIARLPDDKFTALLTLIDSWRDKHSCTKRELLSLIGHLSFAAKVVKPGRLFLRRLIDVASSVTQLHHRIHLSVDSREDILWWKNFLPTWNGISYLQDNPVSSDDIHLFTDASALGIGGVFGSQWFATPRAAFQSMSWFPDPSEPFDINFWELLALVVAFFAWSDAFRDRQVIIYTDNMPLVYIYGPGDHGTNVSCVSSGPCSCVQLASTQTSFCAISLVTTTLQLIYSLVCRYIGSSISTRRQRRLPPPSLRKCGSSRRFRRTLP